MNRSTYDSTNVGLVIQNNFPIDSEGRTRKLAKSLDRQDKNVLVFARNTRVNPGREVVKQEYDPSREEIEYATVYRFSWLISTSIFTFVTAPLPMNPFWLLWLLVKFHQTDIDCVITSDIRISFPAIVAAKLLRKPVITDLRENHVEYARAQPKDSIMDHISRHPLLVGSVEDVLIRLSDELWVNVPERREQIIDRGLCHTPIRVISNTPDLVEINRFRQGSAYNSDPPQTNQFEFTLVYVGFISEIRNLSYIIEAVASLRAVGEEVHFVVAGEGPARESLEKQCSELGVNEVVHFLGWIEPADVLQFLASGDIGVIPHHVNPFTNTTIPNKLFNYMTMGLPVLATDMDPVCRVIEETRCGRIIPVGTPPTELGTMILRMKECDDLSQMGQNGYEAVHDRYNWEQETAEIMSSLRLVTPG